MRSLYRAFALVAIGGMMPSATTAQAPTDTLRLEEAVAVARRANGTLQAARLRADAATERISQAGAWSDPVLSFGLMNRPLNGFGTEEPMTMNVVQLTQRFPWPGKLGFSRERQEHVALAEALESDEVEQQVVARVKSTYFRLAYLDRALSVMRETRELLRNFHEASATLYSVGTGLQQDVLQAQVAVASMTEDITVTEQTRVALAARLNALLGRAAPVPVPWLELAPPVGTLLPVDSLIALAAELRPAIAAARERVAAAEAGYRAARRQIYPDFTVNVGYGQRPQFADMLTIMVGVSVPLFAGSRQLPQRREMLATQAMEEAKALDLYNETFARLTELRADADRALNLTDLYANSVLPQARAAVESALSAYRVGRVDYMTLVTNQMTVNRYEIESVRLAADYHRAVAGLEALVGTDLRGER
jgi:outer membrane protein TolC